MSFGSFFYRSFSMSDFKYLNIGCGSTYHKDWINIDISPYSAEVMAHDLTKGLPYPSNSIDVCYSSHVMEHLKKDEADFFLEEQRRVLKSDGMIRVVAPDLETICVNYLKYLGELLDGNMEHQFRYDYSILELFDQAMRGYSGGELGKLWASGKIDDVEFVISRHGKEAEEVINSNNPPISNDGEGNKTIAKICKLLFRGKFAKLGRSAKLKSGEQVVRILLGRKGVEAFREGVFRSRGEVHHTMYDRFSLGRLLAAHGFEDIRKCGVWESNILDFNEFALDVHDGKPRKPDSLYMEAISP
jgi:predicted SAM-dependent methyltransferase